MSRWQQYLRGWREFWALQAAKIGRRAVVDADCRDGVGGKESTGHDFSVATSLDRRNIRADSAAGKADIFRK